MIRTATKNDLPVIEKLVDEAKEKMKEFNNNQWDDKYPVTEHFEKDIETETLYVLDVDSKIYGFIVIDQTQSEWYDDIEWPVNREGAYVIHRLAGSKDYKGAATELFQFAVDLTEEHGIHVILTDTFALNKPAQNLFEKFGFTKSGEAEMDYHPFDRGAPFYAYYKKI
ncbi:acetyltransferase [Staphylococcus sp. TE8]|uniref:GNAT family N-acetyltransferase n=1 Tax=Staphylococcus sp. TE8 TaxID=1472720 RepID=UPI0004A19740|nr:GNAT family N-acetyltransferase [Staphylococcus sp. TE8]KDE96232.1 acetyltransferase [Staphylococcus sp. TE8]